MGDKAANDGDHLDQPCPLLTILLPLCEILHPTLLLELLRIELGDNVDARAVEYVITYARGDR
jgi:hypothetical protein